MIYDLSNILHRQQLKTRMQRFLADGAVVELTEKTFRSRNQNSYLHLLLGVVAMETGNSLADAKEYYYKRIANPSIYVVTRKDKLGNLIEVTRSSADLTKEEMSRSIGNLKRWAADNGISLPEAGDDELLKAIEIEMGRMANYLG